MLCNDSSNQGDDTGFPNPLLFPNPPKPTSSGSRLNHQRLFGRRRSRSLSFVSSSTNHPSPDDASPTMHQGSWKNRLRQAGAIGWPLIATPVTGLGPQGLERIPGSRTGWPEGIVKERECPGNRRIPGVRFSLPPVSWPQSWPSSSEPSASPNAFRPSPGRPP